MNTSTNDQHDLLYDLIDGQLGKRQEFDAYSRLFDSEELQARFRSILAMRAAVESDADGAEPSPAIATNLFAKVGYAPAAAGALNGAEIQTGGPAIAPRKPGFLNNAAYTALGAIAAFLLMLVWPSGEDTANHRNSAAAFEGSPTDQNAGLSANEFGQTGISNSDTAPPAAETSGSALTSTIKPGSAPRHPGQIATLANANGDDTIEQIPTLTPAIVAPAETRNVISYPQYAVYDQDRAAHTMALQPTSQFSASSALSGVGSIVADIPLEISLHGFESTAFFSQRQAALEAPSIRTGSRPFFRDASIALRWELSDEHTLGIAFGQEHIPQSFVDEDSSYFQKPLLWWIGASYRYYGDRLFTVAGIAPFAETTLGLALDHSRYQGIMSRAQVGLSYRLDSRVRVLLGAELGMLLYNHQNRIFTTRTLGVNYGLSWQL